MYHSGLTYLNLMLQPVMFLNLVMLRDTTLATLHGKEVVVRQV